MIITEDFFNNIVHKCYECANNRDRKLRYGQVVYNFMYNQFGHLEPVVETLGREDVDCFYLDYKISDFIEALHNEVVGKEYE